MFECVVHPNKHLMEGIRTSSQILELYENRLVCGSIVISKCPHNNMPKVEGCKNMNMHQLSIFHNFSCQLVLENLCTMDICSGGGEAILHHSGKVRE